MRLHYRVPGEPDKTNEEYDNSKEQYRIYKRIKSIMCVIIFVASFYVLGYAQEIKDRGLEYAATAVILYLCYTKVKQFLLYVEHK